MMDFGRLVRLCRVFQILKNVRILERKSRNVKRATEDLQSLKRVFLYKGNSEQRVGLRNEWRVIFLKLGSHFLVEGL